MKFKADQGDIYTGFDVDIKSSGPVKKEESKGGFYKVTVNEWKKGDFNGGGAEFIFKNYNGDIYVRKKQVRMVIKNSKQISMRNNYIFLLRQHPE